MTTIITLVEQVCCRCGISFAMPEHFTNKRREDHADFYCPNGHVLIFPQKSKAELLQVELQRERAARDQDIAARKTAEADAAAIKLQLTNLQKRAKGGICPCCHRTVKQMAAHIANKHPEFKP